MCIEGNAETRNICIEEHFYGKNLLKDYYWVELPPPPPTSLLILFLSYADLVSEHLFAALPAWKGSFKKCVHKNIRLFWVNLKIFLSSILIHREAS